MKIRGKITGDMTGCSLKFNPENGARLAYVKLQTICDKQQCLERFGEAMQRVAFSSMKVSTGSSEEAGVSFGYKQITPDMICEYHNVSIANHKQNVQPVIKQITPVKGEDRVLVTLEMPFNLKKDKKIAGDLVCEFGEVVTADFEPAQQELALSQGNVVIKKGAFGNNQAVVTG